MNNADLDATTLGGVLFHNLNQLFISFVTDNGMTLGYLDEDATALTVPIATLLIGTSRR